MRTTVLAIDPGSRETGMVMRAGKVLLGASLVTRRKDDPMVPYFQEVLGQIDDWETPEMVIAVEAAKAPSPHLGITNPRYIISTAQLIGCIQGHCGLDRVVEIEPAGFSAASEQPLKALRRLFPNDLIGKNESAGGGKLRHVRSAWLIAEAAAPRSTKQRY